MSPARRPRLALTPGEPAGIGPDLVAALDSRRFDADIIVFADPALMEVRARQLGLTPAFEVIDRLDAPLPTGRLGIHPIALRAPCQAGQLDPDNACYVIDTLAAAATACQRGDLDALVTAPVHKGVINQAGITFSGHTEYLAERVGGYPVMMLANEHMRVALATTHLALAQVPAAIDQDLLERVLGILHHDLIARFGIAAPQILVAGLNPHAGEGGYLGREEIDIIEPVLARLRAGGMRLSGPLPADTLFTPKYLQHADAVLAMYHDQGLPVLKYAGFGQSINVTLGLPIIRTSVDHGTALDLAGTGRADSGSLLAALELALELARNSPAR